MARTDAQRRADENHRRAHERAYNLKFNRNTNAAELEWFEQQPNKAAYLLELIRKDMKGGK